MSATSVPRVAIVGAGVSGLAAARTLQVAGVPVTVFDKGRHPGGRLSSRSLASGETPLGRLDHGAQFFTARDDRFRTALRAWTELGVAAEWRGRIVVWGPDREPARPAQRFVGAPSMRALGALMASDIDVRMSTRVTAMRRDGRAWRLFAEEGEDLGSFDVAVVTAPAPQSSALLADAPAVQERIADVTLEPCLAVLLAFDAPLELDFEGAFVRESPLSWIAHDGSKPGRRDRPTWVLHASPEWSRANLSTEPARVRAELEAELARIAGAELPPIRAGQAHRWLYALPRDPIPESCIWSADLAVGACGDWCGGPRIEGAFLSGLAVAARILDAS